MGGLFNRLRFEEAMKKAGYNYSTLARALGIGRASLWRKTNGNGDFTGAQLLELQYRLGVNPLTAFYSRK